ncbi:glycosyltransferase [Flavisolibacter nicotianae]|uniref:glycosyltransferase n=1 Tax=Flavisolibacter nicotianae TaxID=2364882 RepID=UPI0013C4F30A|nr:glycosyltransferase [Flavisolibacter nicotianae]
MFLAVVSLLFLAGYTALIAFYYRHWKKPPNDSPSAAPATFVSVVVAARNEEATLPALIADLRSQSVSPQAFEVIIVNDFSTDGTASLALPANFRMIEPDCPPGQSSKKKAIAAGVAQARGEVILVTDADCRVGEKWIATMASFCQEKEASFIAAPVKYLHDNSLLQVLQVLDFLTLQGITAASVSANFHTMCNGANLAYTKKAFTAVGGFAGIDTVPTGDDMLLMHKIWKLDPSRVFYLKNRDAIVSTPAMATWKDFLMQRRRWASKTLVYDDHRITAVLAFVLLLNLLPLVLLVAGFFQPVYFWCLLFFLLGKTAVEWPFVASVAGFFGQQKLMRYFFVLQPLHVFYTVLVGIWSQVGSYEWKGRTAPLPIQRGLSNTKSSPGGEAERTKASLQSGERSTATPPLGGRGAG